jgi:hypothetical protein
MALNIYYFTKYNLFQIWKTGKGMGEMSSIVIHLLIGYLKLVDSATVD